MISQHRICVKGKAMPARRPIGAAPCRFVREA
jgi:hypothetical protein